MPSLHDTISAKLKEIEAPKRCKLGQLIDDLPDRADADALVYVVKAVREGRLSIAWLVKALQGSGYAIGKTVVSEHVRETCACG